MPQPNRNCDARKSDTDADVNDHTTYNSYTYGNRYTHSDSYGDCNADTYGYCHSQTQADAKICADAESSSHTRTEAVEIRYPRIFGGR